MNIGDLPVPEGVSVCLPDEQTCALVMAPRKVEEEVAAEGNEEIQAEARALLERIG
jgi:aminoglycoside phosphotransferase (APT) family kinase protein